MPIVNLASIFLNTTANTIAWVPNFSDTTAHTFANNPLFPLQREGSYLSQPLIPAAYLYSIGGLGKRGNEDYSMPEESSKFLVICTKPNPWLYTAVQRAACPLR